MKLLGDYPPHVRREIEACHLQIKQIVDRASAAARAPGQIPTPEQEAEMKASIREEIAPIIKKIADIEIEALLASALIDETSEASEETADT